MKITAPKNAIRAARQAAKKEARKKPKTVALSVALSVALALLLTAHFSPAQAENPAMTEGVEAFKDGDFKLAESRLGCAQAAEFSNPVFHYYLANTYIKLNKKELAIQEYRIAFALAPEKEVGKLSKQALISLGLESEEKKAAKVDLPKVKEPPKDLVLEHAKSSLQQQAENAKNFTRSKGERDAMEAARVQSEAIAKAQKELEENIAKGKGSKDSLKQLQQLKQYYDSQRTSLERGNSRAQEIQKSADNLQTLLDEKKPIGTRKLSPVGTNLYVRNYADAYATPPATASPTESSKSSATQHSNTTSLQTSGKLIPPSKN
ncbi:MAG: hypothetical protein Q8T09_20165 [Candidatus Melainabacteria bacterium]|nr:hypothetical protein [Candidatus Melainabacteria bacterium]